MRGSYTKGRVSRFGACTSDDVSTVKLIVFGPIRSEYTTPAGYYSLLAGYLRGMPSQRAERGKKTVAYVFVFLFFFVFLHRSRKTVMYTLIEPGLKPAPPPPPRGDIFVLYCSHCLQQSSAFSSGREGGTSLSTRLTSHSHGSFKILTFLYTCFRFKYDVFRKTIISFEAVNRKNNS